MERQHAPVELIYGYHRPQDTQLLDELKDKTVALLQNSEGRVGVFLESADLTSEAAFATTLFSLMKRPSHAFVAMHLTGQSGAVPTSAEIAAGEEDVLQHYNGFAKRELTMLDELYEQYNGRIQVFPEGAPEEDLVQYRTATGEFVSIEHAEMALDHVYEGDFRAALPLYRLSIEIGAMELSERDERIADQIKSVVQSQGLTGHTGYFGAAHTGISKRLRQKHVQAHASFAGKYKGKFHYDPYITAIRYKAQFPKAELNDEGLMINMAQKVIFDTIFGSMGESNYSTQQITAATSDLTRDLKIDDVAVIEQALRTGDRKAINDFIDSLSTQRRIL